MPAPLAASRAQELALGLEHQGVHDGLEALELAGLGEQRRGELLAVDLAGGGRAGEGRLDGGHGGALVELVHLGIGIAHGDAERAQARRDRRLAHADRAGEADDQHQLPSMSATIRARSSAVTCGRHAEPLARSPGTAWCSSMPRPSTAASPRARAAASSGVTSGT